MRFRIVLEFRDDEYDSHDRPTMAELRKIYQEDVFDMSMHGYAISEVKVVSVEPLE